MTSKYEIRGIIYWTIQEHEIAKHFHYEGKNGPDGDEKLTSKNCEFRKEVMRSRDEKLEVNLLTTQKAIEDAAIKVAHSAKYNKCETNTWERENTWRSRSKVH